MNRRVGIAGVFIFAFSAVAALGLIARAGDKPVDDAKIFQSELEALKGQEFPMIEPKLTAWKLELVDAWLADNPTAKDVTRHDLGKIKFSKKELQEIFGTPGNYKVAVYGKLIGTDQASMGTVDQFGMSNAKDATVNLSIYTVVRIVFKDNKLVSVRTWPKLEQSQISGGTWRIR